MSNRNLKKKATIVAVIFAGVISICYALSLMVEEKLSNYLEALAVCLVAMCIFGLEGLFAFYPSKMVTPRNYYFYKGKSHIYRRQMIGLVVLFGLCALYNLYGILKSVFLTILRLI